MKKILFSLIGFTDPFSKFYDGSMLHICRYEKPDVVYLYMTRDYLALHNKDDRYRKALRLLGKQINHNFEIHCIGNRRLIDVHIFDNFYNDFEKALRDIYKEHGRDIELLINMSQGTPAMKFALQVVGAMANSRIRLLQVSDPEPRARKPQEFNLEDYWDTDMDNELQEKWNASSDKTGLKNPNRILEIQNIAFYNRIQRENIVKLIDSYDYQAAFLIAKDIQPGIPDKAFSLLEAAQQRICLKRESCLQILSKIKCNDLMPHNGKRGEIYEYMLWLSIKQMRNDYMDFIRGMTPLLYAVSKYYVEEKLGIPIENYCTNNRNGAKQLDYNKLEQNEEGQRVSKEMGAYDKKSLSSEHLINLIHARKGNSQITKDFELLRNIEVKIRNQSAHQIYAINNDDIKNKTGYGTKEIMDAFKRIINAIGFTLNEQTWNYYDQMNKQIKELLKL